MNNNGLTDFNSVLYDNSNDRYPEFRECVKSRFAEFSGSPFFTTSSEDLFDIFLSNLPQEARQHYTCSSCRNFVNRFGGLVSISGSGETTSVFWEEDDTPKLFADAVRAMKEAVLQTEVTGVFYSGDETLGIPETKGWHHLSVSLPADKVYHSVLKTAGQQMAEKREDFRLLQAALNEYPLDIVDQAVMLLESESLYRSDRILGVALFLQQLHHMYNQAANERQRNNIIWLAVATAPSGFCHIRSTMIGNLLDDLVAGLPLDSIRRRFADKMNPGSYMRAQSAPTQGNIEQAEKIIAKLGIANSLKRRYAVIEDIPHFLWMPTGKPEAGADEKRTGIFGGLISKEQQAKKNKLELPASKMTWEKFQRTVLPTADEIEVKVDNPNRFMALVTACDESAPPIFQWGNPFSWYYHGGIDGEIRRRVENAGGQYEGNEIRCSLIWEGYTDLDLHCVTPYGNHIYYGDKRSRCGGWLDIDMNGGAHRDPSPVENIRWSDGQAPVGHYTFYVHNYCERGKGLTPFKVELEVNGKVYSYSGTANGEGYRTNVFSFNYSKGGYPEINLPEPSDVNDLWNVSAGGFVKVTGVVESPNWWGQEPVVHTGHHIFFLLQGCKDMSEGRGRGFFTETLKPELREIRKTLEAYTASTPIENLEAASACGVGYSKDSEWNLTVKVTSDQAVRVIEVDRWD